MYEEEELKDLKKLSVWLGADSVSRVIEIHFYRLLQKIVIAETLEEIKGEAKLILDEVDLVCSMEGTVITQQLRSR